MAAADVDRVVLVGPASPAALASELSGAARERAAALQGLGGGPVNSLARGLLRAGAQVEVVTLTPEVEAPVVLDTGALRLLVGPYRGRGRARAKDFYGRERRALQALLRQTSGGLLHAHWTYEFALACEADPRPTVVTAHDAPLTILRLIPSKYRAMRTLVAYRVRLGVEHLSAVSPYLAERWRREMAYHRPVVVIPNIAEAPPSTAADPVPHAGPVVLDVTDDDRRKNVRALVRAFAVVRRSVPDAQLRLVGPGLGDDGALAVWARTGGLADGVVFVGRVPWGSLGAQLRAATVFAHPALEEAHPLAVCEAMRCGVPVVGGRRSGGVPWTLGHGAAGVLTDVTSTTALADAVLDVLQDPQGAQVLADRARVRAETVFSSEAVTAAYRDWYASVLAGTPPPARAPARAPGGRGAWR